MEIILKYFPNLTEEQHRQFAALYDLYIDWNAKINVISRKDIENLYEHHVLHSLAIAKVIDFKPGTSIMDLGTGGGFPGIPLAILFPDTKFHLVDSIGKKVRVATEVANAIGLKNVTFRHAPTLSFPVHGTLMVEPTESESLAELDNFVDVMLSIYNEIQEVKDGTADKADNVLVNAPHPEYEVVADNWSHVYSREKAAYPIQSVRDNKFWLNVARVDNTLGDRKLLTTRYETFE